MVEKELVHLKYIFFLKSLTFQLGLFYTSDGIWLFLSHSSQILENKCHFEEQKKG